MASSSNGSGGGPLIKNESFTDIAASSDTFTDKVFGFDQIVTRMLGNARLGQQAGTRNYWPDRLVKDKTGT